MHYLLLAIVFSASMSIVLKIFREPKGNRFGIILGNYLTCIVLAFVTMPEKSRILSPHPATLLIGVIEGVMFVAGLTIMQRSIRINGAMLTTAFAKLGLLVSLAVSILFFKETPGIGHIAGILLVLISMILIHTDGRSASGKADSAGNAPEEQSSAASFPLLLLTLLANGSGDAMSKVYEQLGPGDENAVFFFFLFLTAANVTALLLVIEKARTGRKTHLPELAAGIAVGIPNYVSSFFVLQALALLPAFLVFPVFSTGTILTVIAVSALFFKERPGRRQMIGLGLLLAALVLLNLPV